MNRKMLINAIRTEEVRIAIVENETLVRYEVAASESGLVRGNLYRGIVSSIQKSLSAAFVDIGLERHGLLRADDIVPQAVHRKPEGQRRPKIEKIVEKGQSVLVQVSRDGVGAKGTLLTTDVSLAGRYMVLMPFDEVRGVSRRADDEEVRRKIKDRLAQMSLPEGFGVIARTNAIDQPKTALNRDLNALLRLWKKIRKELSAGTGPRLLYSDQDLIVQALRDFLDSSIHEVLVDDDEAFAKVRGYMQSFMPRAKTKLNRYTDRMPIFSRFRLESQIDRIYQRKVELPCGGSIVIDGTEALTAVDVNSGRATRSGNQEENNHRINVEAAHEVARQLRLRDIGGLVVVDFIDMRSTGHQRDVEKALRESMREDKARFTVGKISPNGLLEINRQRMKKALQLRTHRPCPTCNGSGTIASPDLIGLNLLRRIETRAVTGRLKGVKVSLHPELADAVQNERRQELAELEREFDLHIEVIAATSLHRADERIEWFHRDVDKGGGQPQQAALSAADLAEGVSKGGTAKGGKKAGGERPKTEEKSEPKEAPADKPARRRRRSPRRRKKPVAKNGAEHGGDKADGKEQSDKPAADKPEPARKKTRSRRSRSTKSAKAGDAAEARSDSQPKEAKDATNGVEKSDAGAEPKSTKRPWWRLRRSNDDERE